MGIKILADPLKRLGVLFILRVAERQQELGVAGWPTHILGWTAALGLEEAGVEDTILGRGETLDPDCQFPAIAKIIEIVERSGARVLHNAGQRRLARVERPVAPVGVGQAPADTPRPDLVEMGAGPAERCLQRLVQAIKPESPFGKFFMRMRVFPE